jgi:cytochrome b561
MSVSRSLATRLLHMLLALAIIHQLVISLIMHGPRKGGLGWQLHETVGVASLAIIGVFWLWTLLRRRETRVAQLFPWLSRAGWAALWQDGLVHIAALRRLRLPHGDDSPIASAVHGLGLLTATVMALTGASYFLQGLVPQSLTHAAMFVHESVANLMWAYLIAHAGLAVLHELTGQRVLVRMAPLPLEQAGAD